ncbi:MAG: DPP IV N-terminal domain-containing protein, partial [Ferruginibacter sp.]
MQNRLIASFAIALCFFHIAAAQKINFTGDGLAFTRYKDGNIVRVDPRTLSETVILKKELLASDSNRQMEIRSYDYSADNQKVLMFTNTARVWRYHTRGDYWVASASGITSKRLGKGLPPQSLMFAKFSPDGKTIAYVSEHNIYSEDVNTGVIRKLTKDGSRQMINGTFDWVYEEEFGCRDGFRWSPDGRHIAFWQVNAAKTKDFFMIN